MGAPACNCCAITIEDGARFEWVITGLSIVSQSQSSSLATDDTDRPSLPTTRVANLATLLLNAEPRSCTPIISLTKRERKPRP